MTPDRLFQYVGAVATLVAALIMAKTSWHSQAARVWQAEAEAQQHRADRLQNDMDEVKARLTRIEDENRRLIELLTALDPVRVAALRI